MTWIVPQSIRSAYVQASACSTLESPPLSTGSDTGPVLRPYVSGKPTPRPASWHGWKTRPWSRALFGAAICETSMPSRFSAWWTSSLRACRANRTALQESNSGTSTTEATAKMETDQSRNSCESWKSVAPPWSSAKMCLLGFVTDTSDQLERNYADWVTRSKTRSSLLRKRLERATSGNECSSWPTIRSHEVGKYQNQTDGTTQPTLTGASMNWPTPKASGGGADPQTSESHQGGLNLKAKVATWRTPRAIDGGHSGPNQRDSSGAPSLAMMAATTWPTPYGLSGQNGQDGNEFSTFVRTQWGTPQANERSHSSREVDHGVQLANQVFGFSLPAPTQTGEPSPSTSGRRQQTRKLNARFVEWLMGMPISWTEI